jgi:hypothetical protein
VTVPGKSEFGPKLVDPDARLVITDVEATERGSTLPNPAQFTTAEG